MINLAVNARDAMPENGKLTIETANTYLDSTYAAHTTEVTPGQYVMVAVTDSGVGMTPEHVERAFEPFFTTKGVGKGSGLGLAQVFGFTKQSGGHAKIYTQLSVGTTVKLYLPRHNGSQTTVEEPSISKPGLPRSKGKETILVVEDDEDVMNFTVDALDTLGYYVITAPDADAALAAIDKWPLISLLITDVELPGMDGQQLADTIVAKRPEIPVLYTTGYTSNAVLHQRVLRQSVNTLTKPYSLQTLAEFTRRSLDSKSPFAS